MCGCCICLYCFQIYDFITLARVGTVQTDIIPRSYFKFSQSVYVCVCVDRQTHTHIKWHTYKETYVYTLQCMTASALFKIGY